MNKNLTIAMVTMLAGGALFSCGNKNVTALHGIDTANLNTEVSPKQDFYEYACDGWMAANPLTAEYSRYGTFDALGELNREQLKDIVNNLDRKNAVSGSNAQKVADLYAQGLDSVRLNAEGLDSIRKDLDRIAAANRQNFTDIMASVPGVNVFFNTAVMADMKNSAMNTMYWEQGGLGLGDRDYYLNDDERSKSVLAAYRQYLTTLGSLIGYNQAKAEAFANNVIDIETKLAEKQMDRVQLRDMEAQYNVRCAAELVKKNPGLDLAVYFKSHGIESEIDTLIVCQPEYYTLVANTLAKADEQQIRDYMTASYVSSAANYLSDDFVNAAFELNKVISGVEEQQPRWKRSLGVSNGFLGEALGQLYVEKYFPETSKEKMLTLVGNLQTALGQHIDNLTWMSDTTKVRAKEKLAAFTVKIGYPDKWRDYSDLTINPEVSYWNNIQNAMLFEQAFNNADFGKPVDHSRWYMSPQTVNAYYDPSSNEICFPAGILQPPFFDPEADDAINYGAIGVVIGHEMTHGFDDQGRNYDKDGNMINWWTEADAAAFEALADKLVAQFDEIEVLPGLHANGRLTLGENIADQGGLRVAHTAYHNSLGDTEGEIIEGFTPDQRFYLGYANVWAGNIRDAAIQQRTLTDPHSLGRWRVNASIRNLEPFFQAFEITEGDAMYRPEADRVVIW